jgi:hypothetical protein
VLAERVRERGLGGGERLGVSSRAAAVALAAERELLA